MTTIGTSLNYQFPLLFEYVQNVYVLHIPNLLLFFIDEMHLAKQKSKADADFYKAKQEAAANDLLLTKAYLELKKYEALSNNNKIYYGDSIPKMFLSSGAIEKEYVKEQSTKSLKA